MLSFWEKQSLLETDIAIIGGGITGLSVAASIKERWPHREVTVFERSLLPYGASTRNAGFACFGSLTEVLSDIDLMGEDAARELLFNRWIGLQITRKRLTDKRIGYLPLGGFELLDATANGALGQIDRVNELVADFLPEYISQTDKAQALGLNKQTTQALVSMRDEGQLETGKLMKSLEEYVIEMGVKIRTGANVKSVDAASNAFQVVVEDQHRGTMEFKARQAILCSNAFAASLVGGVDVVPGRGQVLVTEPIKKLKFRGNLHLDEGFYYLRNVGDRIMFGGGRNLDFEKEKTHDFALNDAIQSALVDKLNQLFEFDNSPKITDRWSGIMAFGSDKQPIVRREPNGLLLAVKMSGMGIALAGQIGEMVTDLME